MAFSIRTFREEIAKAIDAVPGRAYKWRGKDDGKYMPGELPIVMGKYNDGSVNQIVIKDYTVADDPSISDSVIGVQFMLIGEPDMAFIDQARDDIFDLFHGLYGATLGTVKVIMAERRSGASLGQNASGRVSQAENYYFTVHRPSTNRT